MFACLIDLWEGGDVGVTAKPRIHPRSRILEEGKLLGERFPDGVAPHRIEGLGTNPNLRTLERVEAGSGRNEVAEDDVFLEPDKVVDLAGQGGFG